MLKNFLLILLVMTSANVIASELSDAVKANDANQVAAVLKKGVNDVDKNLSLLTASAAGQTAIVKLLIDNAAYVDITDDNKTTPLIQAAGNGHTDTVKVLLDAKANTAATDKFGKNAFTYASTLGIPELIGLLVPTENQKDKNSTLLYYASQKGKADQKGQTDIVTILIANGADVNARDANQSTPLMLANTKEIVTLLIARGADVSALDKFGKTAGMYAEKRNQSEIVNLLNATELEQIKSLLQKGADQIAKNNALLATANWEVGQFLIDNGADVNARDANQSTPLIQASANGRVALMKILIAHGADVNAKDKFGKTAIRYASPAAIPLLSEKGATQSEKNSALLEACAAGNLEAVKRLVENGVDVNERDNEGLTPLVYASTKAIAVYLVEHGADINAKDNKGQTVLFNVVRGRKGSHSYVYQYLSQQ